MCVDYSYKDYAKLLLIKQLQRWNTQFWNIFVLDC